MPLRLKTTRNMSVMPSQAESRPASPNHPNQGEGAIDVGGGPQQYQRKPRDKVSRFIEMMQLMHHIQQQLIEEICQLKADKTKEKSSQHNPKNVTDKKETSKGECPQNTEPWFVTMADVAVMLEKEKAKMPKERLFFRRPPYPMKLLNKPYPFCVNGFRLVLLCLGSLGCGSES